MHTAVLTLLGQRVGWVGRGVSLRPRDLLGKQCTCTNHAARHDKLTIEEQGTCIVAWNGTAAPHTQQIVRLIRYTVRACYTSWVQPIPYRAAAVRPRLPGNSPTVQVNRITGMHAAGQVAGCGAQLRTARCAGRNSQNRGQRTCFAAVGWDGASWTRLSHHLTPARARAPPSHPTVMCRVPPSGRTPQGSGWRDGSSKFGRSGRHYARALCSSQLLRHVLNEKQRAARDVARKTEATVRGCRRSVGAGRPPVSV